jgi:hypothetical protein
MGFAAAQNVIYAFVIVIFRLPEVAAMLCFLLSDETSELFFDVSYLP